MKQIVIDNSDRVKALAERINSRSDADFVKRLLSERLKTIKNPDGSVSSHDLAYRTGDDGTAVVYPQVQSAGLFGTRLKRYPDERAYDRAVRRGDTLMLSAPEAELYTTQYKKAYPSMYPYRDDLHTLGPAASEPWTPEVDLSVPGVYWGSPQEDTFVPEPDLFSDEALERRALKQRYAESGFRDNAVSKAGARGAYQIMPITYRDYLGRGKGKEGDLDDPVYSRKIRDWVMSTIPRSLGEFYSESDDPRVRLAKIYGAYNWGSGNMRKYLRKQRDAGVDIARDTSWVEGLNPETRRYIKYLALDEDIENSPYTTEKFESAARKRGYLAEGGKIHIKLENRGKFTALKERTGHSATWFKEHGTPSQKKMAVFALNAAKWKHGDGGFIRSFDMGGPEKTYEQLQEEYNSAVDRRKRAFEDYAALDKQVREVIDKNSAGKRNYAYWKDPEAKRLVDERERLDDRFKADKVLMDAERALGKATIDKYRGTRHDLLRYPGWAGSEEADIKWLSDRAIRESAGAGEVADYFNSYASSPGFQRIIDNQAAWGAERHPYRRIYNPIEYGKSGFTSSAKQMRRSLLEDPMTTSGVFDMSSANGLGFNVRGPGYHFIINAAGNPFPDQHKEEFPYWFELTHEMLHDRNYVGGGQGEALGQNKNTEPGHDSWSTEKHSDLEALRFMLYKEGIYDSRDDKNATSEDIKKLRELYPKLRPLQQMTDEQAAWMINHVADAGKQESMYDSHIGNVSANGGLLRTFEEVPKMLIEKYSPDKLKQAIQNIKAGRN